MKSKLKAAVAAAAVTLLLAACGGDSSGDNNGAANNGGNAGGDSTTIDPSVSIQSVYDYILKLIADNGENSTPVDINGITLAVDETSPPVAFSP